MKQKFRNFEERKGLYFCSLEIHQRSTSEYYNEMKKCRYSVGRKQNPRSNDHKIEKPSARIQKIVTKPNKFSYSPKTMKNSKEKR